LINDHIAWCTRRGLRPNYLYDLGCTLRRLERSVGPLEHADGLSVEAWWDTLPVSHGSKAAYAAHLSSFYRWAVREGLRDDDPTLRFVRPRLRRGLPRPIPHRHIEWAVSQASHPVRAWLLLAAFGGLRACEVASLHADDIDGDVLIIRDGKGGKQRIVPLHPLVRAELEHLPASGWLFPGRAGPMNANTVSKHAGRYLRSVGVPESFHQFRHAFATAVYRESLDLRLTQELLGHASPTTTALYTAWSPTKAAAVVARLTLV
jgi:integrase/recombinase XerC